ncbi:Suppressor of glycerol defect 1 [Lecanosticta acicola]|uniref:Suppressor of glycerol defect 1 n=1 Tax=Lecanosticta acicola TaxID=111012 RepID=A0AAI8YYC9_9PEZI|nr:Suppressor of glycerol defect 1 [Lecanosticta acicola]
MSRTNYGGPKLPRTLLDQVEGGRVSKGRNQLSRKDRRKAERISSKQRPSRARASQDYAQRETEPDSEYDEASPSPPPAQRTKSILKKERSRKSPTPDPEEAPRPPVVSKAVKARLEDDDAEIAALEKRLGFKGKKKRRTGDDELDWLVYGSDGEEEASAKRKRPEDDDWLRNKRRKGTGAGIDLSEEEYDHEDEDEDDAIDELDDPLSEDEVSGKEDFEGFDDEDAGDIEDEEHVAEAAMPPPKKPRENPYIAPIAPSSGTAKYVPPSLRKAAESDAEVLGQLRRQLQGLLNRLSESNIISILTSVQEIYAKNARQHVTSTLIDLLKGLVSDPAALNDTFLILHAGFSAALYRVLGPDFGAQLLESIVQAFDDFHSSNSGGKQTVNLVSFLSDLYILSAIGCEIIFDYIKILLDKENFSESNTELLLRIIRRAGTQLRKDDPTALKDIVLLLQRTISAVGEPNISVRTKFMVETIHDLKNNRMKTGVAASNIFSEHMQQMKKTLGSLKSTKTTEAMHISLSDIRESEKKGKWWLVGASYRDPAKMASNITVKSDNTVTTKADATQDDEHSDAGSDSPNLDKIAREQGMNTDIRRVIFISVAGAVDAQHAFIRVQKLNLKNKQRLEIPRVLLHCVGAEPEYNHYYSLVATHFCGDHKLRKAWQFSLVDLFRRVGEAAAGANGDEEESGDIQVRQVYNIAKLYAALVSEDLLRITLLKPLDFSDLQPKTKIFVQVFLSTIFISLRKKAHKEGYENAVKEAYLHVHSVPEMISGLKYFTSTVLSAAELAQNKKEKRIIQLGCDFALEAMSAAPPQSNLTLEDDLDPSSD